MNRIIICPVCGAEYLPEEIYYPDSVFSGGKTIMKNEEGKIEYYDESLNLNETFCCEHCGKHFAVSAEVNFITKVIQDDFDEDEYVSEIYSDRVELNI